MRTDIIWWAAQTTGSKGPLPTTTTFLWGSKAMCICCLAAINTGLMTEGELIGFAQYGIERNQKRHLLDHLQTLNVSKLLKPGKVHWANIFYQNKRSKNRWLLTDKTHQLVLEAARIAPEAYRKRLLEIFYDEAEIMIKNHKHGRIDVLYPHLYRLQGTTAL